MARIDIKSNFYKIGRRYGQFQSARRWFAYLKKVIPPFMRERIAPSPPDKRILIASVGWYDAKTEAIYAKALEFLGYEAYVITRWDPFVAKMFNLFGIKNIYFYHNYSKNISSKKIAVEAKHIVGDINREEICKFTKKESKVGKYAASAFMRKTRSSNLNFKKGMLYSLFIKHLAHSLRMAVVSERVIKDIKPALLLVNDRGYTPVGQLFDNCLKQGISVIQRCGSHRSGAEILKRYSSGEMDSIHHHSLSPQSWSYMKNISWTEKLWQQLYSEIENTYLSGDWFSEVGTQFNKRIYSRDELIHKLKIDPSKKTAIIFPHMFWDATFFWGQDLFKDYYDWFVNVLKVTAQNRNLNWIIKIHPANIVKARRDNYRGRHREFVAIYETLGKIPSHLSVIPPESDINTFNLFSLMDYCLTVRGTIGVEAAVFGINTLTAGTGRYDHLGFTYDFESKEDYLSCISKLENLPPMSGEMIELARRYAYGIFILRPVHLDLLEHGYNQDEKATMIFRPLFSNRQEFENYNFVRNFRDFVLSGKEDFLNVSCSGLEKNDIRKFEFTKEV